MTKREIAKEKARAKRQALSELSRQVSPAVKEGIFPSVNEGLKSLYFGDSIPELNTYHGWIEKGYQVNKGEEAFLFWGSPIEITDKNKPDSDDTPLDDKNIEFYPLCHLFALSQTRSFDAPEVSL